MQASVEGFFSFAAAQAHKTRQRPSRLIFIPYRLARCYLILVLHYRLVRPALRHVAHAVLRSAAALGVPQNTLPNVIKNTLAAEQFERGQKLLDDNKPGEAWKAFERCLKYTDNWYHFTTAAICRYIGIGRMSEAIPLFQQGDRRRRVKAATLPKNLDRFCVLDRFWALHIGHTAQIDYVVKYRALEGKDPNDTILYIEPGTKVANRFLFDQWRDHLKLVTDPSNLPFPEEYVKSLALDFYVPAVTGGDTGNYYLWELAAQTHRRWAAEKRAPLLQLRDDVMERGRKALASLGVPNDAWFVALHVREAGFDRHHRHLHGVLNAEIATYRSAIEEITGRGGWVIRVGDPSMTALAPLPNVLDYSHSDIRSDWMDIFIAAKSRFFIGTPSGVCYVAQDYGVPCVLTNWWPPAQRPWPDKDIFVPKLVRRNGRTLSLQESLNEPFGYCNSEAHMRKAHGVTVQNNEPEDIRAAVLEMIERLEGRPRYDERDLTMRAQADEIYATMAKRLYNSSGAFGAGVLARDFLLNNPSFVKP